MKTVRHVAIPIVILLFTCSCASLSTSPPTDTSVILDQSDVRATEVYQNYYPLLNTSIAIYTTINDLVKTSHQAGILSDEQVQQIVPVLRATATALQTARSTAISYLRTLQVNGDSADSGQFTAEFILAQETFNGLLKLAKELGVIQ